MVNSVILSEPVPQQRGAALFIALVFLVILTLISITAIRSSTMELRMASNEQESRIGLDSTQSASDLVVNTANVLVTVAGATTCVGFGYARNKTIDNQDCTNTLQMNVGPGVGADNFTQLTQLQDGACPSFIATGVRASGGSGQSCTYFTLNNVYDATAKRGGRTTTVEGMVMETY